MFRGLQVTRVIYAMAFLWFQLCLLSSSAFAQMSPIASWKRLNPQVQYVGKSEATASTSSNTLTTTAFAASPVTGDLIVCAVAYYNTVTISSVIDGNGNTYSPILNVVAVDNGGLNQAIYYKENITGGANKTVTLTLSGNNTYRDMSCHEFSGIIPSGSVDASGSAGSLTSTASISAGPAVTNYTKELIFGYVTDGGAASPGSGFTSVSTQNGNVLEYKFVTNPGSYNITASFSPNANWMMVYATFRSR